MAKEQEARQAQFSRTIAQVINSAYFYDVDRLMQEAEGDEDKAVEEFHRREQQHRILVDSASQAQTEDDLSPEAKKIYDHVQQEIENDSVWQERIYGETEFAANLSPEAGKVFAPNAEDSALLAQAIAEAHLQGDEQAAKELAKLARTPWKIHQALGQEGAVETPDQQFNTTKDQLPKVKPSPFRRGKSYSSYRSKAMVEKTDKLGRRYCTDNGKRVTCPDRGGKKPEEGRGKTEQTGEDKRDEEGKSPDTAEERAAERAGIERRRAERSENLKAELTSTIKKRQKEKGWTSNMISMEDLYPFTSFNSFLKVEDFTDVLMRLSKMLTKPVIAHGMSEPELTQELIIDGVSYQFAPYTGKALAESIYWMGRHPATKKVPEQLHQANKKVIFTIQKNKHDDHWANQYSTPGFVSAATGGDGNVVVYGGGQMSIGIYSHESGHNLATTLWGSVYPSADSNYSRAQSKEGPVSAYAKNSHAEDFAEACMMYVQKPEELEKYWPMKYAALQEIFGAF